MNLEPGQAFRVLTEEIDQWWGRSPKFRAVGTRGGLLVLEPALGGRLFESYDTPSGPRTVEMGRVTVWEPPTRLMLEWRAVNFKPGEKTEVEVDFERTANGTRVTVTHRGWSQLRPDHPVRHGQPPAVFIGAMGRWWGQLLTSLREWAVQA